MKKRDRLEVIRDILLTIQEKDGKVRSTHILYKSNLSHKMMEEYIMELINKGFIRENNIKEIKTYSLEKKGLEYLEKYKLITDFLNLFGI